MRAPMVHAGIAREPVACPRSPTRPEVADPCCRQPRPPEPDGHWTKCAARWRLHACIHTMVPACLHSHIRTRTVSDLSFIYINIIILFNTFRLGIVLTNMHALTYHARHHTYNTECTSSDIYIATSPYYCDGCYSLHYTHLHMPIT
jgi:hypothetical protein